MGVLMASKNHVKFQEIDRHSQLPIKTYRLLRRKVRLQREEGAMLDLSHWTGN